MKMLTACIFPWTEETQVEVWALLVVNAEASNPGTKSLLYQEKAEMYIAAPTMGLITIWLLLFGKRSQRDIEMESVVFS